MKRIFQFSLIFTLILIAVSCKKQNDISLKTQTLKDQLEKLSSTPRTEKGSISDISKPFLTNIGSKKLDILKSLDDYSEKSTNNSYARTTKAHLLDPNWIGPNYITGTLDKIQSNIQIFIHGVPSLADAVYICDVYSCYANVSLPTNSVARIEMDYIPVYGYDNYTTFELGVNYIQSTGANHNTFYMNTYSIVVKYNQLGQGIWQTIPQDLTGMQYAYSYLLY